MAQGPEPRPAAGPAPPGDGEIHVWRIKLAGEPDADAGSILSEPERQRAARFAFGRDRNRYLRARHRVRQILGRYLGIDPKQLTIVSGPNDKPGLAGGYDLEFNLSHSGDCGLLAVGRGRQIGIDIEETKLPADARALARTVFSGAELKALNDTPDDALSIPFFTCWTRKEAVLKALGTGFIADPASITVGIGPRRGRVQAEGRADAQFVEVETIAQGPNWIASLAVVGGFSSYGIINDDAAGLQGRYA